MPDVSAPSSAPAATEITQSMVSVAALPPGSPPDPDAVPSYTHQQILRVVTGIMLCIFLASLDQTVVIPAVPAIAGDLNAFGHLSWIVTANLHTYTAPTPILGKQSDK